MNQISLSLTPRKTVLLRFVLLTAICLLALSASASTTISTDINTEGTLTVTGISNLKDKIYNSFGALMLDQAGQANTNIVLNPTGGNVGIGTITPAYNLDVNGNVNISGNLSGSNIYATTSDLHFYTISVWGDSLTAGYESFLETIMPSYSVYYGGVGGDTSTQIATRMLAANDKHNDITVIWAGNNNPSDPTSVKADIASMIASLSSPKRFLILSLDINSTYPIGSPTHSAVLQLNNDLAALYPNNYLDIRSYLVSQYNSNVPQDVIDYNNDIVPSSLRTDPIHLNGAGNSLVAQKITNFIQQNYTTNTPKIVSNINLPSIFAAPPSVGSLNIIDGKSLQYNGQNIFNASTTLNNYFYGPSGNLSASGMSNIALGFNTLSLITSGYSNLAIGESVLNVNTTGYHNIGLGKLSLALNTTGYQNVAIGVQSMTSNTTGIYNTALGFQSLMNNISGSNNTALGYKTLNANTTGLYNTATGFGALQSNTIGNSNNASGYFSIFANTIGYENTATGFQSLQSNTTGNDNTAIGMNAMINSTTGSLNTALGQSAGYTLLSGSNNTFIGVGSDVVSSASTTLSKSVAIGYNAKVSCSNCIVLGGTGGDVVNVGIGTSTPSAKLQISGGDVLLDNNSAYRILLNDGVTAKLALKINSNNETEIHSGGGGIILKGSSNNELIRMTNVGYFGIGTSSPNSLLHVSAGTSATTTVEFGDQYASGSKSCFNVKTNTGTTASFYFTIAGIVFENNRCR